MIEKSRLSAICIGNGLWRQLAIFVLSFAVVFSKRPDSLLNAQFWAEDGFVFYSEAYNFGWFHAVFRTYFGYFHLVPRLAAGFALVFPFQRAPLVMNLIAIGAYVVPVSLLLSSRLARFGSERQRMAMAAVYLVLPVGAEVRGILTCVQWVLGLSALLVLVATPPKTRTERSLDIALLLASGLSGPFCFFLFPLAAYLAYCRTERWRWVPIGILGLCCLVQATALTYLSPAARSASLGANAYLLLHILGINVLLATILGPKLALMASLHLGVPLAFGAAILGSALYASMFRRAQTETKFLCALACLVLAGSVISPASTAPPNVPRWKLLAEAYGIRYWFLPALSFVWLLIDAAQGKSKTMKAISRSLLVLFCICTALQWRDPAFRDFHFSEYATRFEHAPDGAIIVIPVNPEGRTMSMVKHSHFEK